MASVVGEVELHRLAAGLGDLQACEPGEVTDPRDAQTLTLESRLENRKEVTDCRC